MPASLPCTVRLFARARDLAGDERVVVQLPEQATVADLRAALLQQVPALAPLAAQLLIAVDTRYVGNDTPLAAGQEVACFPPVSGG